LGKVSWQSALDQVVVKVPEKGAGGENKNQNTQTAITTLLSCYFFTVNILPRSLSQ
jgi:hypothetical protein